MLKEQDKADFQTDHVDNFIERVDSTITKVLSYKIQLIKYITDNQLDRSSEVNKIIGQVVYPKYSGWDSSHIIYDYLDGLDRFFSMAGMTKSQDKAMYLYRDLKSPRCMSCLLYTSPSPRDRTRSRMPSSA